MKIMALPLHGITRDAKTWIPSHVYKYATQILPSNRDHLIHICKHCGITVVPLGGHHSGVSTHVSEGQELMDKCEIKGFILFTS